MYDFPLNPMCPRHEWCHANCLTQLANGDVLINFRYIPVEFDFMAVSSYGAATQTSGVVRILKDLDQEIASRDVLIVEDIIDSGLTLNYLLKSLKVRRPASLEVAALLVKEGIQRVPLDVKYTGFAIGPEFVGGYGLDYVGKLRNLPHVAVMEEDD